MHIYITIVKMEQYIIDIKGKRKTKSDQEFIDDN